MGSFNAFGSRRGSFVKSPLAARDRYQDLDIVFMIENTALYWLRPLVGDTTPFLTPVDVPAIVRPDLQPNLSDPPPYFYNVATIAPVGYPQFGDLPEQGHPGKWRYGFALYGETGSGPPTGPPYVSALASDGTTLRSTITDQGVADTSGIAVHGLVFPGAVTAVVTTDGGFGCITAIMDALDGTRPATTKLVIVHAGTSDFNEAGQAAAIAARLAAARVKFTTWKTGWRPYTLAVATGGQLYGVPAGNAFGYTFSIDPAQTAKDLALIGTGYKKAV